MDIKHQHDASSDSSHEKPGMLHLEEHHDHKLTNAEKRHEVEATIERSDVTLDSFAHLDIKKILWKIDIRLIPMLTSLYLLSFLDRGNIGNAKIQAS